MPGYNHYRQAIRFVVVSVLPLCGEMRVRVWPRAASSFTIGITPSLILLELLT